MKLRTWLTLSGALVAFVLASTASATVMVEVPLDDMIREADMIVRGTVSRSGVRLEMTENGRLMPHTITRIRVRQWLSDPGGQSVEIRELGGSWQGRGSWVEGTPRYSMGEDVVVFLERRDEPPSDLRTFAMAQGKFVVHHDNPAVPVHVSRDLSAVALQGWTDGHPRIVRPQRQPAMELETFLAYIRRVRGEGERRGEGEPGPVLPTRPAGRTR